jgi:hypothetical protein
MHCPTCNSSGRCLIKGGKRDDVEVVVGDWRPFMDFVIRSAAVGVIILTLLSYFFLNEDSVGLSYYTFCIFI